MSFCRWRWHIELGPREFPLLWSPMVLTTEPFVYTSLFLSGFSLNPWYLAWAFLCTYYCWTPLGTGVKGRGLGHGWGSGWEERDLAIVGLRQGALAGSTLEWGGVGLVPASWMQGRQIRVAQGWRHALWSLLQLTVLASPSANPQYGGKLLKSPQLQCSQEVYQ